MNCGSCSVAVVCTASRHIGAMVAAAAGLPSMASLTATSTGPVLHG